jgi:hypothetical protein
VSDPAADPKETENLAADKPDVAEWLTGKALNWRESPP